MLSARHALKRLRDGFWSTFLPAPRRRQAAALPWRRTADGEVEILLVTSRRTRRWVPPKGWQERHESLHRTAAREAAEEAGVSGGVSARELGFFRYGKELDNGSLSPCEVAVFALKVDHVAESWPESAQRERRWFAPTEAARLVDEPELGELIAGFATVARRSGF